MFPFDLDECGVNEFNVKANQTINISSPYYPLDYPNDVFCNWTIHANNVDTMGFAVSLLEIDTAEFADRVIVGTGSVRRKVYYGIGQEETFRTTSRDLWISFSTNDKDVSRGFSIEVYAGTSLRFWKLIRKKN